MNYKRIALLVADVEKKEIEFVRAKQLLVVELDMSNSIQPGQPRVQMKLEKLEESAVEIIKTGRTNGIKGGLLESELGLSTNKRHELVNILVDKGRIKKVGTTRHQYLVAI